MLEVAQATVTIVPTMQGAQKTIEKELTDVGDDAASSAGSKAGKTFAEKMGAGLSQAGGVIGKAIKGFATLTGVVIGAGSALTAFAGQTASTLSEIGDMSVRTGLSTSAYQELSYAMRMNGADISSMTIGMKTLTSQIASAAAGNQAASAAFDALGISVMNADGSMRSQEEVMWETMNALQGVENSTQKAALANQLFGRAGTDLMVMLDSEQGSIEALRQEANDLGLVMGEDLVEQGHTLGDEMEKTKMSFEALTTQLGAALLPVALELTGFVQSMLPSIQGLIQQITPVIQTLFQQLLPPIMNLISTLLPSIMTLINALLPILTPVLQILTPFINLISKIVSVLTNALMPIIKIVTTALEGVSKAVQTVVGWFSKMDFKWPKIPMPHFSITPQGWKIGDLLKGSFPKLGISWYAKAADEGAMFSQPTVVGVGDSAQPEMLIGKNTLRAMIGDAVRGSSETNITVNVYPSAGMDEEALARKTADIIQQMTERRRLAYA